MANIVGTPNNDTLTGRVDDDNIIADAGNDSIFGGAGDDSIFGGDGSDSIDAGAGSDSIIGGAGDDTFIVNNATDGGGDFIIGGADPNPLTDFDTLDLRGSGVSNADISSSADGNDAGAFTGTVTFNNGSILTFSGIEQVIVCFAQDTQILTKNGLSSVQELCIGDMVSTVDHGDQPIRWIDSRKISASALARNPKLFPVRITAGALGNGLPKQDLLVSRQHSMFISSKTARRMFGTDEVLIPAIKLTALPGIYVDETVDSVQYFHILFDQHEVIYAQGARAESLPTGTQAMATLSEDAIEEINSIFPDLLGKLLDRPTARFVPDNLRQKQLMARHAQNARATLVL